jgi:hypothetical protein
LPIPATTQREREAWKAWKQTSLKQQRKREREAWKQTSINGSALPPLNGTTDRHFSLSQQWISLTDGRCNCRVTHSPKFMDCTQT